MQYSLGLALSGGSAKGFLHIGVLHYLEQIAHTPEIISGTSAGALIAVLYADGFSPLEIAELLTKKGFLGMTNFQIPQGGLFSTHNFHNMLRKNIRHKHLEDLEIPIRVLATDLDKGCSKVFSEGPTVDIVVASCSIPVLFNPVVIDDTYYVDGGLFKNFPVSTIRRIAVPLSALIWDRNRSKENTKKRSQPLPNEVLVLSSDKMQGPIESFAIY